MIALPKANPDQPETVEHAVDRIVTRLSDAERDTIRNMAEADLTLLHLSLGAKIRDEFGLWGDNPALLTACGSPDMHADSASAVIIRALWENLRDE